MIRKVFSFVASASLITLLATGAGQNSSAAAQTLNSTLSSPRLVLDITDMQLLTGNSARVIWTTQRNGVITIDKYTITLTLTRNAKTETVVTTAAGAATSATVDLRGLSTASLTTLLAPNLNLKVTLKADFTARTSGGVVKSAAQITESKTFTSIPK